MSSNVIYVKEKNPFIKDLEAGMDEITLGIFAFMMNHYGRQWTEFFIGFGGCLDFETWQRVWGMSMEGLTLDQIERGKKKISSGERYYERGPNAGQFRIICLSPP